MLRRYLPFHPGRHTLNHTGRETVPVAGTAASFVTTSQSRRRSRPPSWARRARRNQQDTRNSATVQAHQSMTSTSARLPEASTSAVAPVAPGRHAMQAEKRERSGVPAVVVTKCPRTSAQSHKATEQPTARMQAPAGARAPVQHSGRSAAPCVPDTAAPCVPDTAARRQQRAGNAGKWVSRRGTGKKMIVLRPQKVPLPKRDMLFQACLLYTSPSPRD